MWIGLIFGGVLGGLIAWREWPALVVLALIAAGGLLGYLAERMAQIKQRNTALAGELQLFREHFDQVTLDVHQRLLALEEMPANTAPSPAAAKPAVAINAANAGRSAAQTTAPVRPALAQPAMPIRLNEAMAQLAVALGTDAADSRATKAGAKAPDIAIPPAPVAPLPPVPAQARPRPALDLELPDLDLPPARPLPLQQPAAQLPAITLTAAPVTVQPLPQNTSQTIPQAPVKPVEPQRPATRRAVPPRPPVPPAPDDSLWQRVFGGNMLVKGGIAILFLGLAFLLRYASERVTVPIEVRYMGVAATGITLLVVGWLLRTRRSAYGLLLQGGGVGVLYLTTYAALKLNPLLSAPAAFAILAAVCVFAAMLALYQNAIALAVAGTLGGFAAPVLASTGSGNYVALFSYLLLLNLGIFLLAWFRAWRVLNLLGFLCTLGMASLWAMNSYTPDKFSRVEPFLISFFLLYVAILILFARNIKADEALRLDEPDGNDARRADYVDGMLAFGAPLAGFGMQYQMVSVFEYGAAWSALALGVFYLLLAFMMRRRSGHGYDLLVETFLALGTIFASLSIPLAFDAKWTAAAWAVEAAGVFWVGMRQQRAGARAFSTLVLFGAAAYHVSTLHGDFLSALHLHESLMPWSGSAFGSVLIAASALFCYRMIQVTADIEDHQWAWLYSLTGMAFLALAPAQLFMLQPVAVIWSVLGLAYLYAGLRLGAREIMLAGLVAQALAAFAFIPTLHTGEGAVLASGLHGLMAATLIGLALLSGVWLVRSRQGISTIGDGAKGLGGIMTLAGLLFLNTALLFVLPWELAAPAWGASGLLILWLALGSGSRSALAFAVLLELACGAVFFKHIWSPMLDTTALPDYRPAFMHSGWWVPLAFSIVAYVASWLLQNVAPPAPRRQPEGRAPATNAMQPDAASLAYLSSLALIWASAWWCFAWVSEIVRVAAPPLLLNDLMQWIIISTLLWHGLGRWLKWPQLGQLALALLPAALAGGVWTMIHHEHPAQDFGWLFWPEALAAHFIILRQHHKQVSAWHGSGALLFVTLATLEIHWQLQNLSSTESAWAVPGWVVMILAYLWAVSRMTQRWPVQAWPQAYCQTAARVFIMAGQVWLVLSNLLTDGSAHPLPYLPLLNPLELAQLAALFTLWYWSHNGSVARALGTHGTISTSASATRSTPGRLFDYVLGLAAFICLSSGVLRTEHHWAAIPWDSDALMNSAQVQSALSITWGISALILMLSGHLRATRPLWIAGAVLMTLVVGKLFMVDLAGVGSLARIVSFIVVGLLLLVVGYFAPVPPEKKEKKQENQTK